jgi:GT2 family glycosyltransferase
MSESSPVSAVVINYNGGERVIHCLKALFEQEQPPVEVIVVDNASDDGSPEEIRSAFPAAVVVALPDNVGPAAARNVGMERARRDLVLLVDHDVYLDRRGLRILVTRHEKEDATVICPRMLHYPATESIHCDGAAPHFLGTMILVNGEKRLADASDRSHAVDGSISACLLLRRSEVLAAGGFDSDYFFYFEDLEFSYRMRSLGHRFFCEPAAIAYHDRGSGYAGLSYRGGGDYPPRRFYLTCRNRLMTVLVHYRARTLFVLMPALLLYEVAVFSTACILGWPGRWIQAWIWQLQNWRSLRLKRGRVQAARSVADRELLRGGRIPLAPEFVKSRTVQALVTVSSGGLNAYWWLVRRIAG